MARVTYPKGAQAKIDRLLRQRERLEAKHLRALDPAIAALEASILRAMLSVGGERVPWTIREHARVMRALRSAGVQFGAEVTARATVAARDAATLGATLQPKLMAVMASSATGRRVPPPAIDVGAATARAFEVVDARTLAVGAATGEEIARAAVGQSFLATRGETVAAAGLVALSMMPQVVAKARDRADRVVVTETTAGMAAGGGEARVELVKRYPRMQKSVDAALDRRVCQLCASLHHKVVDIDAEFAAGLMDAPFHARCRCASIGWLAEWSDMLQDMGIGPGERTGVLADVEIQLPTFSAPAPPEFVASRP